MNPDVAIHAARQLAGDVANLGLRVAMLESERQLLIEVASQLRPAEWQRAENRPTVTDPDDLRPPDTSVSVIITGQQVMALDMLLGALADLM